ncbi:hypothetical protein CDD81_7471 [Ophiocordyceps australis]|uniref:Pyridoxamine 5'-phosphate oxidase putative domain-containing protein n=1 Tax=Ophiocordyceps australis TaxID=1399860 RepID=A0A2C5YFD0_9HYPO|nr:hypothetical protein CDD81_7471 [Ophiocordyceps australis]
MKVFANIPESLGDWAQRQPVFFTGSAATHGQHINVSPKGMATTHFSILTPTRCAYIDRTGSGCETVAHVYQNGRLCLMFLSFGPSPRIMRFYCRARIVEWDHGAFADLVTLVAQRGGRQVFDAARAVVDCHVFKVTTSCGYAVPMVRRALYAPAAAAAAAAAAANHDGHVDNGGAHGGGDNSGGHGGRDGGPTNSDAKATNGNANGHVAYNEHCVFEPRTTLDRASAVMADKDTILEYQCENNIFSLDGLPGLVSARRRLGRCIWLDAVKARLARLAAEKEAVAFGFLLAILLSLLHRALTGLWASATASP